MRPGELLDRLTGGQRVFGEPFEKDGVTVITAATVYAGGGLGVGVPIIPPDDKTSGGGEGGGGGLIARPVGAYVIKDGKVRWEPAFDVNRFILGAQILGVIALLITARLIRRRSRGR
jgi:uncharacterized spore protein YtfJ